MTAFYTATAVIAAISAGVNAHNASKQRKQAREFQRQEQQRLKHQADAALVAQNRDREQRNADVANVNTASSDELISTGRRKQRQPSAGGGGISTGLGL